jgi:hypothetical protein
MPEKFANNAVSQINEIGGIDGMTDPIGFTVVDASSFPSDGNFRILIDSEILLVTSVAGNDFTAERGMEGTVPVAHDHGATVRHIFTAGALETKFSELVLTGLYNNLPSSGVVGRQYYCTDSPYHLVDDGSEWLHFVNGLLVTPPDLGDFTWINQGTATATTTYGGILMEDGTANSNTFDHAILKKTAPSPTYSCVFGFIPYYGGVPFHLHGPIQRESSSGKFVNLRLGTGSSMQLEVVMNENNSPTSNQSFTLQRNFDIGNSIPAFVKIVDDGTNRKYYISPDPYRFPLEYYSVGRTSFCTADEIGFHVNTYNQPQACHWIHYSEGP